ncbi:MAG TPA: 2-oxoacid:acceptor oxidoreductase family protein [Terriglobales bacterium]|nr:2-oxoacid:acceptor oxidoreductase family protein [Terriglobales bacterium]
MERPSPGAAASAGTASSSRLYDSITLTLAGSGGDGVALLGDLILRMAARQGLYGMMVQSYGPQIRGGESAVVLRVSTGETLFEGDETDLLLSFRVADLQRFRGSLRLHARSVVVVDAADQDPLPEWLGRTEQAIVRVPFAEIREGREVPGRPKNMLALGLITRALGWPPALAHAALEHRFGHRPELLAKDREAFEHGHGTEDAPQLPRLVGHGVPLVVETGNEALARGAMDAGLRFFAGYPITPSSEVMETLIDELPARGGHVVQAEDEMASMGMVLGASFGGVPAMTATSGPGLSLMTEMMGLSGMAELPAVIVDCQRAGPSTGMPSRTEQADLNHAIYGGHGDFPRAVLGVFDVVHAREAMHRAFHLSEKYLIPVLVLADAYIAQRRQIRDNIVETRETPRRRVWTPKDGPLAFSLDETVPPYRLPGTPEGQVLLAGLEHTSEGWPTADGTMHERMTERRFRKMPLLVAETRDWFRTLGEDDAPRGLVAWGSTYGVLREWVAQHPETRVFLPEILHPFPLEAFEEWRRGLAWLGVLEMSFQAQLFHHLAGLTDLRGVRSIARSGGLPFTKSEITLRVEEAR